MGDWDPRLITREGAPFPEDYVGRVAVGAENAPCAARDSSLTERGNVFIALCIGYSGRPTSIQSWRASSALPIRRAREFGRTENVSD